MKFLLVNILIILFSINLFATTTRIYVDSTGQIQFRMNAIFSNNIDPPQRLLRYSGIIAPVITINTNQTNLWLTSNIKLSLFSRVDGEPLLVKPESYTAGGMIYSANSHIVVSYIDSSGTFIETNLATSSQQIVKQANSPIIITFTESLGSMVTWRLLDWGILPMQSICSTAGPGWWPVYNCHFPYFKLHGSVEISCASCTANQYTAAGTVLVQSKDIDRQGRRMFPLNATFDNSVEYEQHFPVNFSIY